MLSKFKLDYNGVTWLIDPMDKFLKVGGMTAQELVSYKMGIIPTFIKEDSTPDFDIIKHALDCYGFGGLPMGGTIDENGVYSYPQDPDLFPVSKCIAGGKMIYVYEYGMIAFVDIKTKESVTYRFD